MEPNLTRPQIFYIFLLYSLVNFLLFFGSLGNYFLNDDFMLIYSASQETFISSVHFFNYRPVRTLVYKILYNSFGLNPIPYLIFNLLLHILICLAVCLLSMRIFSSVGKYTGKHLFVPSFLIGLLFSALYIHSEAVVYMASMGELLYSLIYLICLLLYFDYRKYSRKSFYVLFCILFVVALLTKETAVSLPLIIFVVDVYLFRESPKVFLSRNLALILLLLTYLPFRFFVTPQLELAYAESSVKLVALEVIKNIAFAYVALFFSLDFMHLKEVFRTNYLNLSQLFSAVWSEVPYIIFIMLFVAVFYLWALKKRDRLINFCILFILITILPFAWLVGYERYLYLSSFGFALLVVYLFLPVDRKTLPKWKWYLSWTILLTIFIYNIFSLIQKNEDWNIAAAESRKIVKQVEEISRGLPSGSEVYFENLPDNYKGAWIFRDGIQYIPDLILKRNDLKFFNANYYDPVKTDPEKKIFNYDYRDGNLSIIW